MKAVRTFQNRGISRLSVILLAGVLATMACVNTTMRGAPPPPLDPADVERGAEQFDRSYRSEGMTGARTYSEHCHAAAATTQSWTRRDFCVAFDFAADLVDSSMARRAGFPRDAYFEAAVERAANRYRRLSRDTSLVEQRLRSIRDRVGPAIMEAAEAGRAD